MLLAHTLQVMVAWAMPCKIQVRKHRSSLPRCFFFPNIPESDNQCISLLRDVPGLCRGPAALQWLLAAEAETFGAIQRAPSASFLPRFSHHWEKPFQDLEKRGLFYKLEESKYAGKDKTVPSEMGNLRFSSYKRMAFNEAHVSPWVLSSLHPSPFQKERDQRPEDPFAGFPHFRRIPASAGALPGGEEPG